MGIFRDKTGDITPICNSCGIVLCYSISDICYEEHRLFWDEWECDVCQPNYLKNYNTKVRENHTKYAKFNKTAGLVQR